MHLDLCSFPSLFLEHYLRNGLGETGRRPPSCLVNVKSPLRKHGKEFRQHSHSRITWIYPDPSMARLNKNFDSDENSLDPAFISHAIPRSPLKSAPKTSQEKQQSPAIPHGRKSHKASTEEGLQIPSLEPIKPFTGGRSGKKTLRRQRPLTPLYVNSLALPTQTAAVRSEHGLGFLPGLRNDKPRTLISKRNMKTPANLINSASEFQIGSSVWEGRQATKDLSDYILIDLTSETDDGTRGDFLQTQKESHKPRGQKLPKMQLLRADSKITQKSGLNFLSINDDTTPSKNPDLEISVADCASLRASISPESGDSQPILVEGDHLIHGQ